MTDNAIDYGPLNNLIGTWKGDKGTDIAPEPDGTERNPYYETITFEAGGDVTNAESQTFAIVPYVQVVQRKSDNKVFHHQMGHWLWDSVTKIIVQSLCIPRGVCCLAGGKFHTDIHALEIVLEVSSKRGDEDWGIIQAPFMRDNASTEAFTHKMVLAGDQLSYTQTTSLRIYDRNFDHTDENVLIRMP